LAWAIRKIDGKISEKNLNTKLMIPEAAQIDYLYQSKTNRTQVGQDNQIDAFFDSNSPNFIGNLRSIEKIICGHSYFTTSPSLELMKRRMDLSEKIKTHNLNYWQSEYCILGDNAGEINGSGMDLGMKTALYLAKVIHADLTYANASAWHWWLSVSANDYKDGLIYFSNKGNLGENDNQKFDADILVSKLLWTLGNFSRFVRPNMKRIKIDFENKAVLASAFKGKNQVVMVLVNSSENQTIELPKIWKRQKIESFVTSKDLDLKNIKTSSRNQVLIKESVTTFVLTKK